jgi:hypothetical protein
LLPGCEVDPIFSSTQLLQGIQTNLPTQDWVGHISLAAMAIDTEIVIAGEATENIWTDPVESRSLYLINHPTTPLLETSVGKLEVPN